MSRRPVLCLLAAAISLTPAFTTSAQSPPADPYKVIVVHGPGSYWGYVRPKTPVADIIDSAGQYLINKQQARSQNEQVRQQQLETRKKEIEFWVWKDKFEAEAIEEKRERIKQAELKRAADNPPSTEIYAGISLNTLLKDLSKRLPLEGQSTTIPAECLPHLHVRSEADRGLSQFSQDKFFWTAQLETEFPNECKELERMLEQVKRKAASCEGIRPMDLVELRDALKALKTRIDKKARTWSPDNVIGAKRLLRQIDDSAFTLQNNPRATFYLRPLQAQTVHELVQHMRDNGLVFGEAMAGDERHYVVLRSVLAEELGRVRPSSAGPK